jgi:hypothetical protein
MPSEADLAHDVVAEAQRLVTKPRRQVGAAKVEEYALRILELFLFEEELAVHFDADPHAVGQGMRLILDRPGRPAGRRQSHRLLRSRGGRHGLRGAAPWPTAPERLDGVEARKRLVDARTSELADIPISGV